MSEDRPKTAHAILADAVDLMLNSEIPEAMASNVAHAELALMNYRLAEKTAMDAPFAKIVNGALVQLDKGDTEAARKFLYTLLGVVDFAPLVTLPVPAAPAAQPPFRASHRHADGGIYQYVEEGWFKNPADDTWLHAVFYRGDDLQLRGTTMLRWLERFTLIEVDPSIADPVQA